MPDSPRSQASLELSGWPLKLGWYEAEFSAWRPDFFIFHTIKYLSYNIFHTALYLIDYRLYIKCLVDDDNKDTRKCDAYKIIDTSKNISHDNNGIS